MEFLEKIDIRSWRNEVQRHLTKWSFFALGYALRSLRVQVSLPSFSQTLVNRSRDWSKRPFSTNEPWELDSFPASTRGKEKREMDPLGGAQNRFVCALNESRLRIDHESFARESEFFPGTKEICFEGWRRPILPSPIFHFNRKFGLREPLPRAKIRACLFPNCHRGRVERKGMEEGIDTGEFKSLRREKGIWFGDLNRVEFLAVGQVFFYFFNFLGFINTSKIHFFSLLSLKRNPVYSSEERSRDSFNRRSDVSLCYAFAAIFLSMPYTCTCIFGPDLLVSSEIAGEGMPRWKISPLTSDDENAMDG